jgi:hypothetical protein
MWKDLEITSSIDPHAEEVVLETVTLTTLARI